MEKSFLRSSTWYEARSADDHSAACWNEGDTDALVRSIKWQNESAIEYGFPANDWLIVLCKSNKIFKTDMNGNNERFHYESITREAIGVYEHETGKIRYFDGREQNA